MQSRWLANISNFLRSILLFIFRFSNWLYSEHYQREPAKKFSAISRIFPIARRLIIVEKNATADQSLSSLKAHGVISLSLTLFLSIILASSRHCLRSFLISRETFNHFCLKVVSFPYWSWIIKCSVEGKGLKVRFKLFTFWCVTKFCSKINGTLIKLILICLNQLCNVDVTLYILS